jgi:hypothetical protein
MVRQPVAMPQLCPKGRPSASRRHDFGHLTTLALVDPSPQSICSLSPDITIANDMSLGASESSALQAFAATVQPLEVLEYVARLQANVAPTTLFVEKMKSGSDPQSLAFAAHEPT